MRAWTVLAAVFLAGACGGDGDEGGSGSGGTTAATDATSGSTGGTSSASAGTTSTSSATSTTGSASDGSTGSGSTSGSGGSSTTATGGTTGAFECDYEVAEDGILLFEAESLTLVDQWALDTTLAGYYGSGYIWWTGASLNNSPGTAVLPVALGIHQAGRYRLTWRTRIGMGADATEHNDIWVRFPDAADAYGRRPDGMQETRRYPKPQCDDVTFMDGINALPQVSGASCAAGSTSDGWMKVYSSGATDWKWSARTSDNDAHDIYAEFDAPGVYALELSARADYAALDRVVLHLEGLDSNLVENADNPETPCP